MLVLRGSPLLSKRNLRNCQLYMLETEWRSPRLLEYELKQYVVDFQDRLHLFFQDNHIIRKQYRAVKSLAKLMRSIIRFIDGSLASKCMFSPPSFNFSFGKLVHPFKIGCFCTRDPSVTCLASSSEFPCGISGYFSKFQVSSEPGPVYKEVLRLALPEAAFLSASCRNSALLPFGPFEEIGISLIVPIF